jgi:hypothetical protein
MSEMELPDTNSPEVMRQVVTLWLTNVIWEQYSRVVHADEIEEQLLEVYRRVHRVVEEAAGGA